MSFRVAAALRRPEVADFFARLIQLVAPKSYAQALGEVTVTRKFFENFGGDQVRRYGEVGEMCGGGGVDVWGGCWGATDCCLGRSRRGRSSWRAYGATSWGGRGGQSALALHDATSHFFCSSHLVPLPF